MTHRFLVVISLLFCQLAVAQSPGNSTRVVHRLAIVIGNGGYQDPFWKPLNSPRMDADKFSALLKKAGYKVIEGTDLTGKQMREKFNSFSMLVYETKADIFKRYATESESVMTVVYYSGHGFSDQSVPFFVGVDAGGATIDDMVSYSYNASALLTKLANDPDIDTLVLGLIDACRQNLDLPRSGRRALSPKSASRSVGAFESMSGKGVLALFGSGDGKPSYDGDSAAENSLFTTALLAVALQDSQKPLSLSELASKTKALTLKMSWDKSLKPPQVPELRDNLEFLDENFSASGAIASARQTSDLTHPRVTVKETAVLALARGKSLNFPAAQEKDSDISRGWIWVGDVAAQANGSTWRRLNITGDGINSGAALARVLESKDARLHNATLIVREKYPGNCLKYPECAANLGALASGSPVVLTGSNERHGNQIWAEVTYWKRNLFPAVPFNPGSSRQ